MTDEYKRATVKSSMSSNCPMSAIHRCNTGFAPLGDPKNPARTTHPVASAAHHVYVRRL